MVFCWHLSPSWKVKIPSPSSLSTSTLHPKYRFFVCMIIYTFNASKITIENICLRMLLHTDAHTLMYMYVCVCVYTCLYTCLCMCVYIDFKIFWSCIAFDTRTVTKRMYSILLECHSITRLRIYFHSKTYSYIPSHWMFHSSYWMGFLEAIK